MRPKYSRGLRAVVGGDQVRTHAETVLDAADRVRERAAAVGEADAQFRQPLEHAAEDQAAGGARLFGRHADQPGQPVLGHGVVAHHVPGMDQDCGTEIGGRLEERKQFRRIEVPVLDMRADLHGGQTQLVDAALEFLDRQGRRLQRHGADAGVVARIAPADLGRVVVEETMQFQRLAGLGPVAKTCTGTVDTTCTSTRILRVVGDAHLGIEGVGPDFAEELAILVDAMATVGVDHDGKAVVAVFLGEVGPVLGQDVGVGVDLEHARSLTRRAGRWQEPGRFRRRLASADASRRSCCGCPAPRFGRCRPGRPGFRIQAYLSGAGLRCPQAAQVRASVER